MSTHSFQVALVVKKKKKNQKPKNNKKNLSATAEDTRDVGSIPGLGR